MGGEGYKRQFGVQETLLDLGYDPVERARPALCFRLPYAKRAAALKSLLNTYARPVVAVRRALHGAPLASEAS